MAFSRGRFTKEVKPAAIQRLEAGGPVAEVARAVRLGDGRLVVNPGSVGCPGFRYTEPFPHLIEAGTPDARYAILESVGGVWQATFRHVPYDHDAMAALARRNGDPEFASALATGWVRRD